MKNLFTFFAVLLMVSTITSCSKDEINQNTDLLGVWERNDFNDDSTYRLVFGTSNTGLKMYVKESSSGEVTSSAAPFNWEAIDNKVTILEDDIFQDIYVINSEWQLVLNNNLRFNKVSDDYLKYY